MRSFIVLREGFYVYIYIYESAKSRIKTLERERNFLNTAILFYAFKEHKSFFDVNEEDIILFHSRAVKRTSMYIRV